MASMSSVDLKTHLLLIQSSALIVKSLLCHLIGSAPPTRLSPPSDAYKSDDPPRSAPPFTTSSSLHNMRYFLIVAIPLIVSGQFNTQRANEAPSDAVPAWYQMSQKQQMAPGYSFGRNSAVPYERPQAAVNYQNYPSYITGRPAYPELMGAAQQARRYPAVGQDKPMQTSLARYHQLLLKRQEQLAKERESKTAALIKEVLPKSLRSIYSTIVPYLQMSTPSPLKSTMPPTKRHAFKWKTLGPRSTSRKTAATQRTQPSSSSTTRATVATTAVSSENCCSTSSSIESERTTSSATLSVLEYFWPNAELLAAIKDVVAKFKASLDETGLDQDVRLMGNQLRNTWQQLRTGVDRGLRAVKQSAESSIAQTNFGPVNEQLGRFFEKVADDANRTPVRKP
ncbi:hypothetical protein Q1695_002666 [Nippostrongylus brasiliensis]|nr:hypothetical protein Q1695_002666 [Nippostrongylus brasiliensis]